MKPLIALGLVLWGSGILAWGQETNQLERLDEEIAQERLERVAASIAVQTNLLQRVFGVTVKPGGVLPQLKRHGWQVLNPMSPINQTRDFQNISVNPHTGYAEGIVLFSFRF